MSDVAERIAAHPGWYHTIEIAPGVVTPGAYDLRPLAARAVPADLSGKRCLDVGTFDGFWAFELESRGPAVVLALDLPDISRADTPPNTRAQVMAQRDSSVPWGAGFKLAAELRESKVQRVEGNVYDLTADQLGGPVDFVLCGTILQHLRDPVAALERMRDVLTDDGELLMIETYSLPLTNRWRKRAIGEFRPAVPGSLYTWWVPNLTTLNAWGLAAGLEPGDTRAVHHTPVSGTGPDDRIAAITFRRKTPG